MTQYKNIPQPQDPRNISQADILGNFQYLCTPISTTLANNGILNVDHYATADNVANPTDGFHRQVSFLNQSQQLAPLPANSVNNQTANSALWPYADNGGNAQLGFLTANNNTQLTSKTNPILAAKGVSYLPALIGGGSILIQWGKEVGSGTVPVTFATPFGAVPYIILGTAFSSTTPLIYLLYVQTSSITSNGFTMNTNSSIDGFYWLAVGPE